MKFMYHGIEHIVFLGDNGTLDTEIQVDGKSYVFSCEYASQYRKRNGNMTEYGLKQLAIEALDEAEQNDD